MHAPQYHETVISRLYPGKQESATTYQPTLTDLDRLLGLTADQKQRTVVRSDAGFGSDTNINWALQAGWQVLTKGKAGQRPAAYARRLPQDAWQALRADRWVAQPLAPFTYVRPSQHLVVRWLDGSGHLKHATLICSVLDWSLSQVVAAYDQRGACETEIQADKVGLKLQRRRKRHLAAQEALILLTDVVHNLLAWTADWMFHDTPLAAFGTLRLIEDVWRIPGRLQFEGQRLVGVELNAAHPHAAVTALGLERLLRHFDLA